MAENARHTTKLGHLANTFADTFTKNVALWIGFSIFWLWPWLLSHMLFQAPRAADRLFSPFEMYNQLSFFAFLGFTLLALAFAYRFFGWKVPRKSAPYIASCALTLSSCLVLASFQIESSDPVLIGLVSTVRSLLGGVGIAILCIECGVAFGALGAQRTLLCGAIATTTSSLLAILFTRMPSLLSQIALVALSVLCMFSMSAASRKYVDSAEEKPPEHTATFPVNSVRIPWKLTMTTVVWTASFGAISAVFKSGTYWTDYGLISYIVAAVALLGCMLYLKVNFNNLIYKVGFLTVALGLAFILFTWELVPESYMLLVMGYRFTELLIWGLYAHLMRTRGISPYWTISLNVGIWTLGRCFGYVAGALVLGQPIETIEQTAYMLVLVVELLLLVSALFLSNHNNFIEGWGMERVSDHHRSERQIEYCCERLASQHDLTLKEKEILAYLVKGMTRSEISEKLVVSPETVKTHARHIYKKMGAGSREDILNMVDQEIALGDEY